MKLKLTLFLAEVTTALLKRMSSLLTATLPLAAAMWAHVMPFCHTYIRTLTLIALYKSIFNFIYISNIAFLSTYLFYCATAL